MSSSVLSIAPSVDMPARRTEPGRPGLREVPRPAALSPLRAKLLDLLPVAERVLVLGAADDGFVRAFQQRHPDAAVLEAGASHEALAVAADACDLVVLPDGLVHLDDGAAVLALLARQCAQGVGLYIEFDDPLHAPLRAMQASSADNAILARGGCRASLAKLLMDAGWMPNLVDLVFCPGSATQVEGLVVTAARSFDLADLSGRDSDEVARFAVVVPTNSTEELEANVNASPGLSELQAPVFAVRNARSPSVALDTALPHVTQDWVLICHQDVYFPKGFGRRLNALLASIAPEDHARTLLGFVGKSVDVGTQGYRTAGFVVDRLYRHDEAGSDAAVSIDELALVVSRESIHKIDPAMGWHLWATDLCLTSICQHEVLPRIVRLPLFHNSRNDSTLDKEFHTAAAQLLKKFPEFGPIPTMCGTIVPSSETAPLPAAVAAAPVPAHVAIPPQPNGCCICAHPVREWLAHPHIGARSEFSRLLGAVGSDLSVYQCPACFSTDRDRHLWHYMNAIGLPDRIASMRVLHIAPERHIEALLLQIPPLRYVRGDLHPRQPEHHCLDVEALPFADASFDLIICNHVLEHVASPAKALAQFHRCLDRGGVLIAQTPYAPAMRNTFEMNAPVSPAFARLFYGQDDHARLFGADIVRLFHDAGFAGDLLPHDVVLPGLDAKANGCNASEPFFCFSK